MTDHCDKCGTALDPAQERAQPFSVGHADPDVESLEGQLCSDCFVDFRHWLDAE